MDVKLVNDGPVTISLDSQEVNFPRKAKPTTSATAEAPKESAEVDVPWYV